MYSHTSAMTLCLRVRSALIMYFHLKIERGHQSKANSITHSWMAKWRAEDSEEEEANKRADMRD